jgi:amino acid transporter
MQSTSEATATPAVETIQPDQWGERLPRKLGLISVIAALVGITIGSGIFRVPATVAAQLHEPGPMILAWVIGGLIALFGALTLSELAASMPRSGGIFAYLLEGFGPMAAFLFGWSEVTVIRASALGATSTIFAEYLGFFLPLTPHQIRYVAATAIIAVGVINYIGILRAAAVMNVASIAKYVALIVLAILALTATTGSMTHFSPAFSSGISLSLLATALIPVMWTYDGWADASFIGGEVKDPQRTMPLALTIGTILVVFVYLIINIGFIHMLPPSQMANSSLIATKVAERIPAFGAYGAAIIAALVVVSTFSGLNGSMMGGPRIFFAMADRGLFFKAVARVSPRFQSPSVAIWLATVLGVIYVLQNDFAQLADKFVLGVWPFYALAVAAVFVLRKKRPDMPRPYKTWGYPLIPLLFLLASFGMVLNALWTSPVDTGITFGIMLAGIPIYYVWMKRRYAAIKG